MSTRQLKFGAAPVGVGGPGQQNDWLSPEIPGDASVDIGWYIDLARCFEAARLDFVFVVDSQFITADSPHHYLNRLEPLTLLSALAVSTSDARAVQEATVEAKSFARTLAEFGRAYGWHDFSQYDPDGAFPDVAALAETGGRTIAVHLQEVARERGLTLRETVRYYERLYGSPFVGSPRTVAAEIERWFTGRAADGFILHVTVPSVFARFADEVLPLLRERGLFRSGYEAATLRGNLGLPIPENVHTLARAVDQSSV